MRPATSQADQTVVFDDNEGSPSSFMRSVTSRLLVGHDTRALAQLRRHPLLVNATQLVSFANDTHVPRLPEGGKTRRRRPVGFICNPTLLDDDDDDGVIVKVSTYSYCSLSTTSVSHANRQRPMYARPVPKPRGKPAGALCGKALAQRKAAYAAAPNLAKGKPMTAWVQRGQLRAVLPWTEDARAFRLRGHAHMLFSRKNLHCYKKNLNVYKKVWLARLEPTYREVYLNFSRSGKPENNWVPIPYGDELYVLHTICDNTRGGESLLLRCDPRSGHCKRAFFSPPSSSSSSTASTVFSSDDHRAAAAACPRGLRGGSPLVRLGEASLVGVAHRTLTQPLRRGGTDRKYVHYLYRLEAAPPFRLLNVSTAFSFPRWFNSSLDDIQFGTGLARRGADSLALSFGVGDCAALEVRVPVERVRAWVGG